MLVPVIERIDALSEDAKRLIKICSCFTTDSFARNDLTVAKSFLTSPLDECLNEALDELSDCLMIVPLIGPEKCDQHTLKFSHLILMEASNNLMLESQRKAVHAELAKHFSLENSSSCNDLEKRAMHHMRAGHKETACTLLCSAAIVAYKSNHRKKAAKMMSEVMEHEKNNINKAYMLGLFAWLRVRGKHQSFFISLNRLMTY